MRLHLLHNLALTQHQAFSIIFCFLVDVQMLSLHHKKNYCFFLPTNARGGGGGGGIDVVLPHTDIVSPKQPFNLHYNLCILCFTRLLLVLLVIRQSIATFNCYFDNQIQTSLPRLTHV